MNIRLQECIQNREQYILQLCSMSDVTLARKIDLIHEQLRMAYEEKNTDALELLQEWLRQVIAARIKKDTEKIADAPDEMKIEIERMEAMEAMDVMQQLADEREKVLEKIEDRRQETEEEGTEETPPKTDEQLSLF